MQERIKNMKEYLYRNDGFISAYFLLMLCVISTWTLILANNAAMDMKTVANMKENARYYANEAIVISDIKCHLENGIETGEYEKDGVAYYVESYENCLYVTIEADYGETVILQLDEEKKSILSCSFQRGSVSS